MWRLQKNVIQWEEHEILLHEPNISELSLPFRFTFLNQIFSQHVPSSSRLLNSTQVLHNYHKQQKFRFRFSNVWNFANFHTLFDPKGWRNWDDRVQMVRTLREGAEDRKLDWSLGLKASEIKWEKLLKNIQDSLLRLGDGVKTDERNGCKNEREGRKNGWTLGFSCGNLCFASVTECRKMRGMGTWRGKLGRKNTASSECMKLI